MTVQLQIIGFLMVALGIVHIIFPKMFDWKTDLGKLSLINRQMMLIHTFFIALSMFLVGILCFTTAQDMVDTSIGRRLCLGLSVFFGTRFFIQFFGYSPELWKGKKFETAAHIFFVLLWGYFTSVFLWVGVS